MRGKSLFLNVFKKKKSLMFYIFCDLIVSKITHEFNSDWMNNYIVYILPRHFMNDIVSKQKMLFKQRYLQNNVNALPYTFIHWDL